MKTNPKTGDPVIPKMAWLCMAAEQAMFADSLALLVATHEIDGPLFDALCEMVREHDARAEQYDRAAAAVKKGRPRVKQKTAPNAIAAALLGVPIRTRKKRGAPVKFGPRYDRFTYELVEKRRAELAASNLTKPTVSAAIESVDREMARNLGRSEERYVREARNATRASYRRGKLLVSS